MRRSPLLGMALVLALCLAARTPRAQEAAAQPGGASAASAPSYAADANYRIGIDDILDIVVFQAPDLSATVKVDAAGGFVLPLAGRVTARGHTNRETQQEAVAQIGGNYMGDPVVTGPVNAGNSLALILLFRCWT